MHAALPALLPRDASGCQFVVYGDCCSGVAGAPHEANFAAVNAVLARLDPAPEFICFLGDELSGLTADYAALRAQWRHWLDREMAWLDRARTPLYQATSNHVTYDAESEQIFREQTSHLPRNGPAGQEGLAYAVRIRNVLLVFIHTSAVDLGGDGWVESTWLDNTLRAHADAEYKLVLGHQPIYPVNGYAGARVRDVMSEPGQRLWSLFVEHGVFAYVCSHMLAFDIQVHQGVLQLMSAGAGTAHVLPGEYLHCTQCALDRGGLRFQTLDVSGVVRESAAWPMQLRAADEWQPLARGSQLTHSIDMTRHSVVFACSGELSDTAPGYAQTLLSAWSDPRRLTPLWVGFCGVERELSVVMAPVEGRSPQIWRGPQFRGLQRFSFQLALHPGLGAGGVLWRAAESAPWSSLTNTCAWGSERLATLGHWSVGCERANAALRPYLGEHLQLRWCAERVWDAKNPQ